MGLLFGGSCMSSIVAAEGLSYSQRCQCDDNDSIVIWYRKGEGVREVLRQKSQGPYVYYGREAFNFSFPWARRRLSNISGFGYIRILFALCVLRIIIATDAADHFQGERVHTYIHICMDYERRPACAFPTIAGRLYWAGLLEVVPEVRIDGGI